MWLERIACHHRRGCRKDVLVHAMIAGRWCVRGRMVRLGGWVHRSVRMGLGVG